MTEIAAKPSWIERALQFLEVGVWQDNLPALPPLKRAWRSLLQIGWCLRQSFFDNQIMLRAGGLTYTTLLSIVPTLAFAFAVLKGMGVHNALEPAILAHMTAGSQEIVARLIDYVDRVNVGSLGAIGLLTTLLTVIMLLGNIENAFNQIWKIQTPRPVKNQFSDYLVLVVVMPLFLFAALSVTASLKSAVLIGFVRSLGLGWLSLAGIRLAPYVILWLFFTFFYMFMPNTRVRLKPALIAGVVIGTCWQVAEWAYITLQVGFAKYNAIYGTFAQLPIMMVWLYVSWVIVLAGAELSYTLQHFAQIREHRRQARARAGLRLEAAVALLEAVQRAFVAGLPGRTVQELAAETRLSQGLVQTVLASLAGMRVLAEASQQGRAVYLPARDLAALPFVELLEKFDPVHAEAASNRSPARVQSLLAKAAAARRQALEGEYVIEGRR